MGHGLKVSSICEESKVDKLVFNIPRDKEPGSDLSSTVLSLLQMYSGRMSLILGRFRSSHDCHSRHTVPGYWKAYNGCYSANWFIPQR